MQNHSYPEVGPAQIRAALRASPAFADWPGAALEELSARCRVAWLQNGARVAGRNALGPCSYLVLSGWLTLRYRADPANTHYSFALLGRGMIVCDLMAPTIHDLELVVRRDVGLIEIPSSTLRAVLAEFPGLWPDLMLALLDQEQALLSCVVGQLTGSVSQRIAQTVLHYARLLSDRRDDALGADLNLSQDELGSLLRLSRATVGRELSALESEGLIDRRYGQIHVNCMQSLCGYVSGVREATPGS